MLLTETFFFFKSKNLKKQTSWLVGSRGMIFASDVRGLAWNFFTFTFYKRARTTLSRDAILNFGERAWLVRRRLCIYFQMSRVSLDGSFFL